MKGLLNFIINKKVILFTIALLLLNFILKIFFLASNDIARDEPFSIYHAQMKIPEIIAYLKMGNNPPLYEIILHFWIKLFGISAFSVRLPSLIFSCLTAWCIFKTGKFLFSFSTGAVASLVFTFATLHTYYAHEARVYPLFILLAMLSFLLLMKYLKDNKKIFLVLLCVTDILLIYAHYFGFFILFNQLLSLLFYKQKKLNYKLIALVAGGVILSFVPMLTSFVIQLYYSVDRGTWVEPPLMNQYYGFLNIFINNKYNTFVFLALITVLVINFLIKKNPSGHFIEKDKQKPVLLVFLWFFLPYSIMFIASFKAPMFIERYIVFTSVFYYLAIASFICLSKTNKILKASLILIFLAGVIISYNIKPYNNRDISKAVSFTKDNKTDSTLVFVCPDYDYIAFTYHYNSVFFNNYNQTKDLLAKDNVFPVSSKAEVMKILSQKRCNQVVYFQSISQFVDHKDEIYSFLSHQFDIKEKKSFFEIYTVTVMEVPKVSLMY